VSDGAWFFPELHDASPANRDALARMLDCLDDRARAVAAVLVVPDWGGMAPIDADPEFAATVRALAGPRVLHGLTHTIGRTLWDHVWYGTSDEGEFARLGRAEAHARLRDAVRRYAQALGEQPTWFCAPRWRASGGTLEALDALGIRGVMHRDRCTLPSGETVHVPALWFDDGRRPWTRAGASVLRARIRARLLAERRPFRLALHPRDVADVRVRREIASLLARLASDGWEPRSIDDLPHARRSAA
jgi:predicted deacetylase